MRSNSNGRPGFSRARNAFARCVFGLTLAMPAAAQDSIPLRAVAAPHATARVTFGALPELVQLSTGTLLINDVGKRQILFVDSALTNATVVSDTATGAAIPYGRRNPIMVAYLGDSTLLIEAASETITILGPDGRFARVAAHPRGSDFLLNRGRVAADTKGRVYYRIVPIPRQPLPTERQASVRRGPDSAVVVRADFESRAIDTIVRLKIPMLQELHVTVDPSGAATNKVVVAPFSWIDDWALLPDGTVAVVRGQNYHVDWIAPDGGLHSKPRMPYDWRRLSDEEKRRLADSSRALAQMVLDSARARAERTRAAPGASRSVGARSLADGTSTRTPLDAIIVSVSPTEIPDHYPPIRVGSVLADFDGRVWVMPLTSRYAGGGVVYDVVNRSGALVERVQLPAGRSIVGFGRDGVLFVAHRAADATWRLEATRVQR